ncbi:TerB family tellurite resistance protein [Alteromonas sp. ASW11-36]|uniref:TerB family tellurite resistance protein n=1 Tax=Alteromonas arenosi TaxID=3055817 RepID=A0ABT7SUU1_9ALTE|nr:TerB family tellurite resistance protein [Alteromonas sp. ASW11-36]MDM7859959.1 TerB family tellurite resistance protein [Alteromonas sp. ASW11-36]
MIKSFLALFERQVADQPNDQHTLELASAALLFEVVRADREFAAAEREQVSQIVTREFNLSGPELKALLSDAEEHAENAVDLVQFTRILNQHYDLPQRAAFIQHLWTVAYADNELDMHEEHVIRRIADLMHVPHSLYMQAKLKVKQ